LDEILEVVELVVRAAFANAVTFPMTAPIQG
jgi:hypothetical protein